MQSGFKVSLSQIGRRGKTQVIILNINSDVCFYSEVLYECESECTKFGIPLLISPVRIVC